MPDAPKLHQSAAQSMNMCEIVWKMCEVLFTLHPKKRAKIIVNLKVSSTCKLVLIVTMLTANSALAQSRYPTPTPDGRQRLQRTGTCPTGYIGEGSFCEALRNETPKAVPKIEGRAVRRVTSRAEGRARRFDDHRPASQMSFSVGDLVNLLGFSLMHRADRNGRSRYFGGHPVVGRDLANRQHCLKFN